MRPGRRWRARSGSSLSAALLASLPSSPATSAPLRLAATDARASASLAASSAATRSSVRSLTWSVTVSLALPALDLRNPMRPSSGSLPRLPRFACAYPPPIPLHLRRDRRRGQLDQGALLAPAVHRLLAVAQVEPAGEEHPRDPARQRVLGVEPPGG